MITSNVFNIAQIHADALHEVTGKTVVPAGRSILSALVGMTCVGSVPDTQEITHADVVTALTQDSTDGPSEHTSVIGAYIDRLTPMVASHIAFIQNNVAPKVTEFEAALDAVVARASSMDPSADFNVVQVSGASVMGEQDFSLFVERFADGNVQAPGPISYMPAMTVAEIIEKTKVSASDVNESIKTWLVSKGDAWVNDVWAYYFASSNAAPSGSQVSAVFRGNFAGIAQMPAYDRQSVALLVFLLARGLMDSPLDIQGVNLTNWRSDLDAVSRWAANQAVSATRLLANTQTSGTVVIATANNSRTIVVDSANYAKFLSQGGSVVDVIGAVLYNKNLNYTVQNLQESGSNYRKVWENFAAMSRTSMDARAASMLRAEAVALLETMCKPCNDDEAEILNTSLAGIRAKAKDYVESLSLKALMKTRDVSLELVAGIRFAHTPAKQFLTDMVAAQEAGCQSPQEAAALAGQMYIADFLTTDLALVDQ